MPARARTDAPLPFDLRLEQSDEQTVVWRTETFPPHWVGTTVRWDVEASDAGATVNFRHTQASQTKKRRAALHIPGVRSWSDSRPTPRTANRIRCSRSPMLVDVQTEIEIERARADVAVYAADPDNATAWYVNIKSVEWKTARPLAVGSQVAFLATFLGRRLAYTYEITEFASGERFVMSTADGPFAMETTYSWEDTTPGSTRMILRNRGEPTGFSKFAALIIGKAMRRANRKDLQRLKAILEAHPSRPGEPAGRG